MRHQIVSLVGSRRGDHATAPSVDRFPGSPCMPGRPGTRNVNQPVTDDCIQFVTSVTTSSPGPRRIVDSPGYSRCSRSLIKVHGKKSSRSTPTTPRYCKVCDATATTSSMTSIGGSWLSARPPSATEAPPHSRWPPSPPGAVTFSQRRGSATRRPSAASPAAASPPAGRVHFAGRCRDVHRCAVRSVRRMVAAAVALERCGAPCR
jgi:hypothetical protein